MDNWKLPKLRAHQQFLLGRIDGLKWVLTQPIDAELRKTTWQCIHDVEKSNEDVATRMRIIVEEREAKKKDQSKRNGKRSELA